MNIDEVMKIANDYGASPLLRHVIEQHVSEVQSMSADCRTCRHLAKLDCMSTAMCIDASQYKSTNPLQMWKRTR